MTRQSIVAIGCDCRIPGAHRRRSLRRALPPGALQPRLPGYPTIVAVHVVLGGLYLTLAPFQFVRRIRSRHLAYHRRTGRILVAIGLVVGATALFMGLVIPFSGWGRGDHRYLR